MATDEPFGIYVHWPFCAAKCPYCDFNSHVRAQVDQMAWARALCAEIDHGAREMPGRRVHSIFFGGGTPSLMEPHVVGAVLDRIASHWTLLDEVEITLEANPTSIEAGRFAGYATAGVNRVSVGVQALRDADLRRLGRLHTVSEALAALDIARRQFSRVSFDLIYARQDQTLNAWEAELQEALALGPDHMSLYQLTIEPDTAFGRRHAEGRLAGLPDGDMGADLYELTQVVCEAAGLPAYEVSNHARIGAKSRHNLIYWRGQAYAGVGPGAHGRIGESGSRVATETLLSPEAWRSAVERQGHGRSVEAPIAAQEEAETYLMMALRLSEGADLLHYKRLAGGSLNPGRLNRLVDDGLLLQRDHHLIATPTGRLVLNAVLRELLS